MTLCRTSFPAATIAAALLLAVALLFAAALPLWAHDFWIEPSTFRPAVGSEVALTLRVGQDFSGNGQPYIPAWFSDYRVSGPDGDRAIEGIVGDDPAGGFVATGAGMHVVGYRSTRDFVELAPELFRKYLAMEGLEFVERLRAERGESEVKAREFYSRCVKSLILAGDGQPGRASTRCWAIPWSCSPNGIRTPWRRGMPCPCG